LNEYGGLRSGGGAQIHLAEGKDEKDLNEIGKICGREGVIFGKERILRPRRKDKKNNRGGKGS